MPIYEFKCSKCQSTFEVIQKVNAPAPKNCLKCGAPVRKIISPSALQFKGSGWYITDYAQKDKKKLEPKETKKPADVPAKKKGEKPLPTSSTK